MIFFLTDFQSKRVYLRSNILYLMKHLIPILTINGSDSRGIAGIQADIRTMSALGTFALTAISSVAVQDANGIKSIHDMPLELLQKQTRSIIKEFHPKVVKIGLLRDSQTVKMLRDEVIGIKSIVLVPGILSSQNELLMSTDAIKALCRNLVPISSLLMLRCNEAELMLGMKINSDDDMIKAVDTFINIGAESVLLRGGKHTSGLLTALLYENGNYHFFTSHNMEGWQKHGVGGALSAAISARLALGDDVVTAVSKAHDYMHKQVVYSVTDITHESRKVIVYNDFMSLVASHYNKRHDVLFYAEKLCISVRYLSKITNDVVGLSPKKIITDYVTQEAKVLLETTNLNIQEISAKLGFASQTAFAFFYKKNTGTAPNMYRNFLK